MHGPVSNVMVPVPTISTRFSQFSHEHTNTVESKQHIGSVLLTWLMSVAMTNTCQVVSCKSVQQCISKLQV